jgi:phage virion morphogenesis protein
MLFFRTDDDAWRADVAALKHHLSDLTPVTRDIATELKQSTRQRFLDGQDPEGRAWRALSLATLITGYKRTGRKRVFTKRGVATRAFARHQARRRILMKQGMRGGLMGSIASEGTHDSAIVSANKRYAAIHQLGGRAGRGRKVHIPARPYLGVSRQDEDALKRLVSRYLSRWASGTS